MSDQQDNRRSRVETAQRFDKLTSDFPDISIDNGDVPFLLDVIDGLTAERDALRADVTALEDILGQTYLYVNWRHVSRQLTTTEKERYADATDAWSRRLDDDPDKPALAERWWRPQPEKTDSLPVTGGKS